MNDYLALTAGVICAGIGGELFVRGAVGLAHWARVSPGIIGATVVAFATSSPELAVAVSSALAGEPQISLGDALGSNVVNVALILGIALTISAIRTLRESVKRDLPVALLVPVITGVLFLDGVLSRIDGWILMGTFIAWLAAVIYRGTETTQRHGKGPWGTAGVAGRDFVHGRPRLSDGRRPFHRGRSQRYRPLFRSR